MQAYYRLARESHPDRNPDVTQEDFAAISMAYDTLIDPDKVLSPLLFPISQLANALTNIRLPLNATGISAPIMTCRSESKKVCDRGLIFICSSLYGTMRI